MFKDYLVKNRDLNEALKSKWVTRLESDGDIPKNRFVEVDASTGKVEVGALDSTRIVGANQDLPREEGDFFDCETGIVTVTAGSPIAAGQRVKCGTAGKAISFIDSTVKDTEIASFDGAGFTNQPATDTVTVVSSSAEDTTQSITLIGVDSSGAYISETLELKGTTDVDTASALWDTVSAVILDAACVGAVEVSETTGGKEIITLAAGELSDGIETIADGYAYNKIATVVADNSSTGKLVIVHEATDGAAKTNLVATLNSTTEVPLGTASYKITTVYTGGVADSVNVELDVTGTADSEDLICGRALTSGDAGDEVVVNVY